MEWLGNAFGNAHVILAGQLNIKKSARVCNTANHGLIELDARGKSLSVRICKHFVGLSEPIEIYIVLLSFINIGGPS